MRYRSLPTASPVLRSTAIATGSGLSALAALMRPDDVPPGRGRTAYRLAYGALGAGASLATTLSRAAGGRISSRGELLAELGIAAASGVLSAALFDERISANWWSDRALARLGVPQPREVGAVLTGALSAGALILIDQVEAAEPFGFIGADADADAPEDPDEVELTADQRAVLDRIITGGSANARILREQLSAARFTSWGDADRYEVELVDSDAGDAAAGASARDSHAERLVPHTHTYPNKATWVTESGVEHILTLEIEDGRLAAIDIAPRWEIYDADPEFEWEGIPTAEHWPSVEQITVVKDSR